ncbi:MAG: hypothetical protein Q8Q35_04630 [Nanoarchaeota archaeon]|nr:hypothetical protein [Nanoarchaeota archaeon]
MRTYNRIVDGETIFDRDFVSEDSIEIFRGNRGVDISVSTLCGMVGIDRNIREVYLRADCVEIVPKEGNFGADIPLESIYDFFDI